MRADVQLTLGLVAAGAGGRTDEGLARSWPGLPRRGQRSRLVRKRAAHLGMIPRRNVVGAFDGDQRDGRDEDHATGEQPASHAPYLRLNGVGRASAAPTTEAGAARLSNRVEGSGEVA